MYEKDSILIVDDDESTCRTMSLILGRKGYDVETAATGRDGLEKAQGRFFNLALLDIKLPDMEGIELLKPLKEMCPDMAEIIVTAYASMETAMDALNKGASAYITKPLNMDEVLVRVKDTLEKQRLIVENRRMLSDLQREVTERKQVEELLRKSEAKYHTLFESSKDGIAFSDMEGNLLDVNQAFLDMLGYTVEEIRELTNKQLTPRKWHETEANIVKNQIMARGYSDEYELEYIKKDGTVFPIAIRAWLIIDEQGKPTGMWAIVRDIAQRKEIDRVKTEFISTVSHELRTPLAIIRETVSQVLDGVLGETTEQQREFLHMSLVDVDRLARMINELLDVSKIEENKLELKREIVDVVSLAREVSSIFYLRAKEKGLELTDSFSGEPIEVYADADRIVQVFTNLVGNALKFTPAGRIEISVVDKEDRVECSVSDTGVGIPETQLSEIFHRFQHRFQQFGMVHGPGGKGGGLGLSIARGIVELHRGKIWVESVLNEGSKFSFTLPKHGEDEIIHVRIERGIAEARKGDKKLSVFVIRLDDWSEIEKDFGEDKVRQILHKILGTVENVIRSGEFVATRGKNEIIVLAEVDKKNAPKVNARVIRAVKEAVSQVDEKLEMNFSYGYSTYPDDSSDAEDLLERAYESVVS